MRKLSTDGSINGNGHASGLVNGGGEDAEGRAEQGGLVGLRGIKASPGRPNISAVLARTVQEYSGDQEIGVVAAGAVQLVRRLLHSPPHLLARYCHDNSAPLHLVALRSPAMSELALPAPKGAIKDMASLSGS